MEQFFQINPQLDIPIYQQLVDSIRSAVKSGKLRYGQQLPTVQQMSEDLSIARGTIKRAYDELEREEILEKAQGRGTFVCYRPANSGSRKETAMDAIDGLLDKLEKMGFSSGEINIFLNLKLRERSEQEKHVKVAVVECNPENLTQLSEQLRGMEQIDLYSYLVDQIQEYPYKLGEDIDLVVTTAEHAPQMERILTDRKKLSKVALRLSAPCLSQIIKLRWGKVVGILGYSQRFAQLLFGTCQNYTEGVQLLAPETFTPEMDMYRWLEGKDAVLVPKSYERYCSAQVADELRHFQGELIECSYELDEGSYLYLLEKTKRILQKKTT